MISPWGLADSQDRRQVGHAGRYRRFASEFDSQPFHLDEAAAERTPLKGLAASGWHTAAIAMRLMVDARPLGPHPLFGVGVGRIGAVFAGAPGDVIHLEGEVIERMIRKDKATGNCTDQMERLSISMVTPCTP